ncbi:hypothetical protein D9M69_621960 [compost metagenome]
MFLARFVAVDVGAIPGVQGYATFQIGALPESLDPFISGRRVERGEPLLLTRQSADVQTHGEQRSLEHLHLGFRGLDLGLVRLAEQPGTDEAHQHADDDQYHYHLQQGEALLHHFFHIASAISPDYRTSQAADRTNTHSGRCSPPPLIRTPCHWHW